MKKYLLYALVALIPSAQAQTGPKIVIPEVSLCGSFPDYLKIIKEFEEEPIFLGKSKRTLGDKSIPVDIILSQNKETGTWTYVEVLPDRTVCILDTGTSGKSKIPARSSKLHV